MKRLRMTLAHALISATIFLIPNISTADSTNTKEPVFQNKSDYHHYDRQLRASMRIFQERTGIQIGIILLDKLPASTSIEHYAAETLTRLKIGANYQNRGLLFVMAEKEHLFKMEVSYALEGVFPDALCHRLETGSRTFMLSTAPYAQRDFLAELMVTMGLHYLSHQGSGQNTELYLSTTAPGQLSAYLSGGAGIVGRGYAATLERINSEVKPLTSPLKNEMQADATIETVVKRYMQSLEMGIGDPALPLLTEGSHYFRLEKPLTAGYLQRISRYMNDAMPYRVIEHDDLAAVMFKTGHPVLPILLRRNNQGLWFVDEPSSSAEFQLSDEGKMFPKYRLSPYSFATEKEQAGNKIISLYQNRANVPPLPPYNADLLERIKNTEIEITKYPNQAHAYLKLAEIFQYEMYWLRGAAPLYEKVLAMNPERIDLHWRLIDIYRNMEEIDEEEKHYKAILKRDPEDYIAKNYYHWLKTTFRLDEYETAK